MPKHKPPNFDFDEEAATDSPKFFQIEAAVTETIDFAGFADEDVTESGFFDLRQAADKSFGGLMNALPVPALLVDNSGTTVFANRACATLGGQSGEIEGKSAYSLFVNQSFHEKARSIIADVFATRRSRLTEALMGTKSNKIWARINFRPIRIGVERLVLFLVEDLTAEKKQLLTSKRYQDELEKRVSERTAQLRAINERLESEIGERKRAEQALQRANEGLELRVQSRTAELRGLNEELTREVFERKRAEDLWRLANQFKDQLLSTAATAIFTVDAQGNVTGINDEFCLITGLSPDEMVGKSCHEFCDTACKTDCVLLKTEPGKEILRQQCEIRTGHGRTLIVLKNATPIDNEQGDVVGAIESFVDVTELIEARKAAEGANVAKSAFLANMSHELRTPLNAIIGFSDLLLEETADRLNEDQSNYLRDVLDSGHHLLNLINDILELSRAEPGGREPEISSVNVRTLLENTLILIKEKALKHGLAIDLTVSDELEETEIRLDELMLKQIMFNLLSNAVKFTPSGGNIRVEAVPEGNEVLMRVSDTGVGVDLEDQERIFAPFEQIDSSYSRQHQGTGLGLALAKSLTYLLGGRIWMESEGKGKGSTFILAVPFVPGDTAESQGFRDAAGIQYNDGQGLEIPDAGREAQSPTVLVIEDSRLNMEVATAFLTRAGYLVLQAETAEEGIGIAKNKIPALILMDISLPDMDGLSAARVLKRHHLTSHIPIVALTGYTLKEDEENSRAAGCDGFIPKPIDPKMFTGAIASFIGPAGDASNTGLNRDGREKQ